MPLTNHVIVFVSGFFSVFSLGFQSRLINTGNVLGAALGSFFIGCSQTLLWSELLKPGHTMVDGLVYGASGACAVVCAMSLHNKLFTKKEKVEC